MDVSENSGTPKWMVYNGKPYEKGWFGGTTIFGNTQIDFAAHSEAKDSSSEETSDEEVETQHVSIQPRCHGGVPPCLNLKWKNWRLASWGNFQQKTPPENLTWNLKMTENWKGKTSSIHLHDFWGSSR